MEINATPMHSHHMSSSQWLRWELYQQSDQGRVYTRVEKLSRKVFRINVCFSQESKERQKAENSRKPPGLESKYFGFEEPCIICHEDMIDKPTTTKLQCGHVFHADVSEVSYSFSINFVFHSLLLPIFLLSLHLEFHSSKSRGVTEYCQWKLGNYHLRTGLVCLNCKWDLPDYAIERYQLSLFSCTLWFLLLFLQA